MAVPKKRTSKRRKGMRRAHDYIQYKSATTICEDCGALKLCHHEIFENSLKSSSDVPKIYAYSVTLTARKYPSANT